MKKNKFRNKLHVALRDFNKEQAQKLSDEIHKAEEDGYETIPVGRLFVGNVDQSHMQLSKQTLELLGQYDSAARAAHTNMESLRQFQKPSVGLFVCAWFDRNNGVYSALEWKQKRI